MPPDSTTRRQQLELRLKACQEALARSPTDPARVVALALVLKDLGRTEDAVTYLRQASALELGAGRVRQAARICRRILDMLPGDEEAKVLLEHLSSEVLMSEPQRVGQRPVVVRKPSLPSPTDQEITRKSEMPPPRPEDLDLLEGRRAAPAQKRPALEGPLSGIATLPDAVPPDHGPTDKIHRIPTKALHSQIHPPSETQTTSRHRRRTGERRAPAPGSQDATVKSAAPPPLRARRSTGRLRGTASSHTTVSRSAGTGASRREGAGPPALGVTLPIEPAVLPIGKPPARPPTGAVEKLPARPPTGAVEKAPARPPTGAVEKVPARPPTGAVEKVALAAALPGRLAALREKSAPSQASSKSELALPPALLQAGTVRRFEREEFLFREGEAGNELFQIQQGRAELVKWERTPRRTRIEVLQSGACVGELALLGDGLRHLSCRALTAVEALVVPRPRLREAMSSTPTFEREVRSLYRNRLQDILLRTSPFFSSVAEEEAREALRRFRPLGLKADQPVIGEGAPAPGLFIVLLGRLRVTCRPSPMADPVLLALLGDGDLFGEMSLVREQPASATVQTVGFVQLLHLALGECHRMLSTRPELVEQLEAEAKRRERVNHAILRGAAYFDESRGAVVYKPRA